MYNPLKNHFPGHCVKLQAPFFQFIVRSLYVLTIYCTPFTFEKIFVPTSFYLGLINAITLLLDLNAFSLQMFISHCENYIAFSLTDNFPFYFLHKKCIHTFHYYFTLLLYKFCVISTCIILFLVKNRK